MQTDAWFYNIYILMHLYNKDILEYAQILVTSGTFMIYHIEVHSASTILHIPIKHI